MNSVILKPKLDSEPDYNIKVLTIGDQSVGKTSLLKSISTNNFDSQSPATIGIDFHSLHAIVTDKTDETRYRLQMWDCSGQSRFQSIVASYYRHAHAILIVYDVTNSSSFHRVAAWKRSLDDVLDPNMYITFLIANKTDFPLTEHEVSTIDGDRLALDLGFNGFYEVSARTQFNLPSAFKSIVSQVHNCIKSGALIVPSVMHREIINLEDNAGSNACLHGCTIS